MHILNGWLIIDKPYGLGSTQALGWVKRILRPHYGKVKIGHGGTLDPLATGVLPIALGESTKVTGRMLEASKAYDFTIGFGTETDSLDLEGQVIAHSPHLPLYADIAAVLERFTGEIAQTPPAYSALKLEGQRAYDLARAGKQVELAARHITINSLILKTPPPQESHQVCAEITLSAHVSKGTYIRALARDIAHALGTYGHVTMLRRTQAGAFTLAHTITLDNLEKSVIIDGSVHECLLPLRSALADIPVLALDEPQALALKQGKPLATPMIDSPQALALMGETPVALVEIAQGIATVLRGFNFPPMSETEHDHNRQAQTSCD
jgi:tRNA pseudouridine55 synthase